MLDALTPETIQALVAAAATPGGAAVLWSWQQNRRIQNNENGIAALRERRDIDLTAIWKAISEGQIAQSGMKARLDSIDKHLTRIEEKLDRVVLNGGNHG